MHLLKQKIDPMKETREIMGMPVTIEIADTNISSNTKDAVEEAFAFFIYVDETFSPYKQESELMKINRGNIYYILRLWKKEGITDKKLRGGPISQKMPPAVSQDIVRTMQQNPTATLKEMARNVSANVQVALHPSTIFRHMKRGGLGNGLSSK